MTLMQVAVPPVETYELGWVTEASLEEAAIQQIMLEMDCPEAIARMTFMFIRDMVAMARRSPGYIYHLTTADMDRLPYQWMDRVMGHNRRSSRGSAYRAIERALLVAKEFALLHLNYTGEPQDCAFAIQLRAM